ncbi:MAG: mannose-6-phosphate isomerase [Lentisphaerae bacterium]|nr:mannose-6-phosphate isomerase [Lentisphaerota bacterium]
MKQENHQMPYPLFFKPVYRNYIWGGNRISSLFSRSNTPVPCAESWEISARQDGMGIVENGSLAGKTLEQVCYDYGKELLGSHCEETRFPLLVKLIDANKTLSVQVHPNEENALRYGGEPKTEMWYFLDASEDSHVYAGLKRGTTVRGFQEAIKRNKVPDSLEKIEVQAGKAMFIPGGLVHAIGAGSLIMEVQQNSDTTYRIYDWGHLGTEGKPRELHVPRALEVVDWRAFATGLETPFKIDTGNIKNKRERVIRSDIFTMERYTLNEPELISHDDSSFKILFAKNGAVNISWDSGTELIECGRSCLIPANMPDYSLIPASPGIQLISVKV